MASPVGSIFVDLRANTARFVADMKKASKQIRRVGKDLSALGKQITLRVTVPIIAVAAASIKAASDAEEMESKFQAVFGGLSGEVRQWAKEHARSINRSRFALQEYLATLQDTFVPMGLARKQAAGLSKQVAALAVDLASFNNRAEPEVVQALTSALVGNHEAVRQFGVVITEASLKQELLNMGHKEGAKAASEQEKMLARLRIILRSTKDAQGDAARTSEGFANQLRGLKAAILDMAIDIGNILLPQAREFVAWIKNWSEAFKGLSPEAKKFIVIVGGLAAAVGPLLFLLGAMASGLTFLLTPIGLVSAAVLALTGVWATWGDGIKWMMSVLKQTGDSEIARLEGELELLKTRLAESESGLRGAAGGAELFQAELIGSADLLEQIRKKEEELAKARIKRKALEGKGPSEKEPAKGAEKYKKELEEIAKRTKDARYETALLAGGLSDSETKANRFARSLGLVGDDALILKGALQEVFYPLAKLTAEFERAEENQRILDELAERAQRLERFGDQMGGAFTNAFEEIILGSGKVRDVLAAMLNDLARLVLRYSILDPMARGISKGLVGDGSTGGILGSFIGSLAGRQHGGPVSAGRPYVVGERGPEVFMPRQSGSIVPNEAIGGAAQGPQTININIIAADARSFADMMRRNPEAIIGPFIEQLKAGNQGLRAAIKGTA